MLMMALEDGALRLKSLSLLLLSLCHRDASQSLFGIRLDMHA